MNTTVMRARRGLIAIVAGIVLALGASAPALADATDDLVAVDGTLSTAVNDFLTVYSDSSTSADQVIAAAQTFQGAATDAQSEFQSIAEDADGEISDYATKFAGEAGDMATGAGEIADAFTAQDETALAKGESDLNAAIDAYKKTADEYNQFLKTVADPSYVGWLIVFIIAVVFLILTLLFAIFTRKQTGLLPAKADKKGNVQQASLTRMRWMVVLWAAVFVVGAAIPFFQVLFAQPDANGNYTYTVFWYPLAAGVILSIVGVVQYFIAASKVRREGSAPAFDPNAPEVPGVPLPGAPVVPGVPAVPVAGAPVVPAPVVPEAPVTAAAEMPAAAPEAPASEVFSAAPEAPATPEAPVVPEAPAAPEPPVDPAR